MMLRYDHHPAQQRDALAQRQAVLDAIVDYRFLAPYKIAADERRERALAHVALLGTAQPSSTAARSRLAAARRRLGAGLIAIGTGLQRDAAPSLGPQPEP
jgi:hypothetical protein